MPEEEDVDSEIDADIQKALLEAKKKFKAVIDKGNWDISLGVRVEAIWFYEGENKPVVHKRYLLEEGMEGT